MHSKTDTKLAYFLRRILFTAMFGTQVTTFEAYLDAWVATLAQMGAGTSSPQVVT